MCWIERETIDFKIEDLPFDEEGKLGIIDPSKVRVKLPSLKYPYDIGAWCYTERQRPYHGSTSPKTAITLIKIESFRKPRVVIVGRYLDYINSFVKLGKSTKALPSTVSTFNSFIYWCDRNMPDGLDNKKISQMQYGDFRMT